MLKKLIVAFLLIGPSLSFAGSAWYAGEINRIWPHDSSGGFIITFTSPSNLSDCKHGYAYFRSNQIQPDMLKSSFSLALAAMLSNKKVNVVIDKSLNGVDGYCNASSIDIRN